MSTPVPEQPGTPPDLPVSPRTVGSPEPSPGASPAPGATTDGPDTVPAGGRSWYRRTPVLVGAGAVVALVLVVGVLGFVSTRVASPTGPVTQYLAAVEEGRLSDAFAIGAHDVPAEHRGLLDDELYADVPDRPTGANVVDVSRTGSTAYVLVESLQDGAVVQQEFQVTKQGRRMLVLDRWVLTSVSVPEVEVWELLPTKVEAFAVDGVVQPVGATSFRAMPGTYTLSLPVVEGSQDLVTSTETTVTVQPGGYGYKQRTQVGEKLEYSVTDAGATAAGKAAESYLEAHCEAATSSEVEACALRLWGYRVNEDTVSWALGDPTTEVEMDRSGSSVVVHVTGEAAAAYETNATSYSEAEAYLEAAEFDFYLRLPLTEDGFGAPEFSKYTF